LPRPYQSDEPEPNVSSGEVSVPDPEPLAITTHEAEIPEEDQTSAEENTQDADENSEQPSADARIPQVRTTYSRWLLLVVWAVPSAALFYFSHKYFVRPLAALIAEVLIVGIVAFWWSFTLRTLRERVPPAGWKSQIKPKRLFYMSESEFDSMRFELGGDDDDLLEDHKVLWASKYSRATKFWMYALIVLACISLVGMLFVQSVDISLGSGLPHEVNIIWVWPLLSLLFLVGSFLVNLDWNYKRLLVDEALIYHIKENPPWLPWRPGDKDPLRLEYVAQADPIDTSWGKLWGHGTVKLKYQTGIDQDTIYLKKVPRHRDFCNMINAMSREARGGSNILM
jgi:hypothetical protein